VESYRWSIRTRLTLLSSAVVAGLCTLFAAILLLGVHRLATEQLIDQLVGTGGRVASSLEEGQLRNPILHTLIRDVQVVDQSGRVVGATAALQGKPPIAEFPAGRTGQSIKIVCDRVSDRPDAILWRACRPTATECTGPSTAPHP
jgi:hypothetical protein